MKNGILKTIIFFLSTFFLLNNIDAKPVTGYSVTLHVLDKITARIDALEILVGESAKFGSLEILIYHCKKRPPEEVPEDFVLMKILDEISPNNFQNIFHGWMISSSPTVAPLEHATYDIWIKDCKINKESE